MSARNDGVPRLNREPHRDYDPGQVARRRMTWDRDRPSANEEDRPAVGRRSDGLNRGVFS